MICLSSHSKLTESIGLYIGFWFIIAQEKWEEEEKEEKSVGEEGIERKEGEERRKKKKNRSKYLIAPQNIFFLPFKYNLNKILES